MMPDLMIYLLKANFSLVLFYWGYRMMLRRLTFYDLNRFYLLFALLFSFVYPLVEVWPWVRGQEGGVVGGLVGGMPDWRQVPSQTFLGWTWVTGVIAMGSCWFGGRLAVRLISLWRLHRRSRPAVWQWYRYRQVPFPVLPFSFWHHIYLHRQSHDPGKLDEIFRHEQVHVDGLHTVDVLLAEVVTVACWFNPWVWSMRTAIRQNLEFLTDRRVLASGVDKKAYQYSLLAMGQRPLSADPIGNGFTFKNLKQRVMMMNRQKSSRLQLGTYVVAVPVIAVLLWVFTLGNATGQEDVGDGPGRHADTTARDSTWIKPRKVNPREALYIIDGEERDYSAVEESTPLISNRLPYGRTKVRLRNTVKKVRRA